MSLGDTGSNQRELLLGNGCHRYQESKVVFPLIQQDSRSPLGTDCQMVLWFFLGRKIPLDRFCIQDAEGDCHMSLLDKRDSGRHVSPAFHWNLKPGSQAYTLTLGCCFLDSNLGIDTEYAMMNHLDRKSPLKNKDKSLEPSTVLLRQ